MQALISALFDRWAGRPILVIGGGPSVNVDLPRLDIVPACVISVNDHGFKQKWFKPDLIVNADKRHVFLKCPMEEVLRPHGVPIVNKHSWADYRLADWTFSGNSGMNAVVVACALGGNPVIATGLDFWRGGRLYFHDGAGRKPMPKRQAEALALSQHEKSKKVNPLRKAIAGANFRPMSGPLCLGFPTYDPNEVLPPTRSTPYREHMLKIQAQPVTAAQRFCLTSQDLVGAGQPLVLSPREAKQHAERVKVASP